MASNFLIRVQLDDGSLIAAQQKIRNLGNFAVNTQVAGPNRQQLNAVANQVAGFQKQVSGSQSGQAARANAQATQVFAQSSNQARNSIRALESDLQGAVLAHQRLAGTQLAGVRATQQVGIATSQTTRLIARGQLSIRALGNEILLVATKVGLFTAAAAGIGALIAVLGGLAKSVADVNDAMIGLERVTNDTFNRQTAAPKIIKDMRELHVSATDAATAAFEMGKAYGDMNEALAASHTILLANKVAEIDLAQASQQLVQVSNAFNLTGFQGERVLDKLNAQQNTLGVNIGKTLEATARAAQVTKQAGGTLDELVARTAVGIRFTGFAPETVSRSQARLAQQILSIKGNKQIINALQGSAAGQSVLEKIVLPDDSTKLQNDVDKVFNTIGASFQSFSDRQKNAVAEALTGGRQGGLSVITGALLENFNTVQKQANASVNAQGSSSKELFTVLKSIREQVKGLGAEFQVLGANIENSGLLGVFGSLLALLKEVLTLTNDIFGAFNQLPDAVRLPVGSLLGGLGAARLVNSNTVAGRSVRGLFTPGSDRASVRQRDQELATAKDVASVRVASDEAHISAVALAGQREIDAAARAAAIRRESFLITPANAGSLRQAPAQNFIGPLTREQTALRESEAALGKQSVATAEAFAALTTATGRLTAVTAGLTGAQSASVSANAARTGAGLGPAATQIGKLERSTSLLNKTLGKALTPGGALLGSLGFAAAGSILQGNQRPGSTSVLGSTLSGAGLGLTAGLFTGNPLIVGGAVAAGTGAGLLEGIKKRADESKDRINADSELLSSITRSLDDTVSGVEELVAGIEIDERAADRINVKQLVDKFNKNANKLIGEKISTVQDAVTGIDVPSQLALPSALQGNLEGTGAQAVNILGEERARALQDELNRLNINKSRGALSDAQNQQRDDLIAKAITERIQEAQKDRETLIDSLDTKDRELVDALRVFASQDKGDQAARGKLAGQTEQTFRTIIDEFNQGDKDAAIDDIKNLKENRAAFALFIANANQDQLDAVNDVVNDKSFFGLGKADDDKVAAAVQALEAQREAAQAIQADAKSAQTTLREAEAKILEQVNAQVANLQRQEGVGLDPVKSAKSQINALLSASTHLTPGTEAGREIQLLISEAFKRYFDARAAGVKAVFDQRLATAPDEQARAAILNQEAVQLSQLAAFEQQVANGNLTALANAGITVTNFLGQDAVQLAKHRLAVVRRQQAHIAAAIAEQQQTLAFQQALGAFTSGTEALINNLNAQSDSLKQQAANAQKTLNSARKQKNNLATAAANVAQFSAADLQNQAAALNSQAANIQASGPDPTEAARELLQARFELLKAIARGDDVKVARITLRQAQAEARLAKTRAEKLRAQAAIINAKKDLRSSILNERQSQIDFLLETEQITSFEAIRRLQGLLKFAKGNKDAVRQLKLKIFQLTKEARNDRTFGLPSEIPLPSVFELRQIIGTGQRIARLQAQQQISGGSGPQPRASGGNTTITNRNNIQIVVRDNNDLKKVRSEINRATGQTVKQNSLIGVTPGLI